MYSFKPAKALSVIRENDSIQSPSVGKAPPVNVKSNHIHTGRFAYKQTTQLPMGRGTPSSSRNASLSRISTHGYRTNSQDKSAAIAARHSIGNLF